MAPRFKEIIGQGIYTVPEVARLTGVSAPNIYNWLYGGSLASISKHSAKRQPTIAHQFEVIGDVANLSFGDMIQVRLVAFFRNQGVSLQSIRKAADNAAKLLSTSHPFCSTKFKTDGTALLAEVFEPTGESSLVELHSMQHVFKEFINPFLTTLEYEQEAVSKWWHDLGNRKIVLDPKSNYGKPTVAQFGYSTETLFEAFVANGSSFKKVSDWFEVPEEAVQQAVDFEMRLAA